MAVYGYGDIFILYLYIGISIYNHIVIKIDGSNYRPLRPCRCLSLELRTLWAVTVQADLYVYKV